MNLKPREKGQIVSNGKVLERPHWQRTFGKDYAFSNLKQKADPIEHEFLIKLVNWVNQHSGKVYQGIVINWYMDGKEYIGPHSDNEYELVPDSPIYSFSFGAPRDFVVESKDRIERYMFPLKHNTVLLM